jgi:hypothetical protein
MVKETSTRKLRTKGRSMVSRIRENDDPRKGIFFSPRSRKTARSSTRVVRTVLNESATRRHKKAKRKAKDFKLIAEIINDPEIRENIGLYIDEHGNLVGLEGDPLPVQYDLLIQELQHQLQFADDSYEEKILRKAIKFVTRVRDADSPEMSSLERMMADL